MKKGGWYFTVLQCVVLLGLLLPAASQAAMRGLIYQPQTRDRAVPPEQWQTMWQTARKDGFDTLVLQWTAHGEAFTDEAGRAWLQARMQQAHDAGLALVIGLHSDPEFFTAQEQQGPALTGYLHELARNDAALALTWRKQLSVPIAGWYLPMEIDDRRWRERVPRAALLDYLRVEMTGLHKHGAELPVYVTAFTGGFSTPDNFAKLLADASATGVRVWWQDGAGTGKLKPAERGLYRTALNNCTSPAIAGIVHEAFKQTGSDQDFKAEPLAPAGMRDALDARAPCNGDSVVFELRYLPLAETAAPQLRGDASTGPP